MTFVAVYSCISVAKSRVNRNARCGDPWRITLQTHRKQMEQQQLREAIYGQIRFVHDRRRKPIVIKQMNRQAMAQQRALRTGQPVLEDGFQEVQLCHFLQLIPHPHLVTILCTTITSTEICIAMPYYSNGELHSRIASKDNPLPPAQLLQIFQDIVSGMNHLHQHHIAHLDLLAVQLSSVPSCSFTALVDSFAQ